MNKFIKRVIISFIIILLSTSILQGRIIGSGASFPANVYFQWAYDYAKITGNKINYQSVGSGTGIRQIITGTVDFGASDVPLKVKDLKKNNLIQFPTLVGVINIVVNIDGVKDFSLKLNNKILANIFLGKITKWNNPTIVALNKNIKLPNAKIVVIHRSDGSGTTANFTKYLSLISPEWKKEVGFGKSIKWKVGISGKGNEGISNLVKITKNSIAYVEESYKVFNKFSAVRLEAHSGKFVTTENKYVYDALKNSNFSKENGFATSLLYSKGDSYPIITATYILLRRDKIKKNIKIVKFIEYAYNKGDNSAMSLNFIPLNKKLKSTLIKYLKKEILKK